MESDREQCLGAGMDDFVAKPVRKQALRRGLAQFSSESGPALPAGPDSSTSDEQILDPQPLDELRELAEFDADFSISSFIDLFLEEAPKTLARAVTALQEADVELSIGMCTR
jgi:protein-histidine pros-kinase